VVEGEGLHHRQTQRNRKASLSDGVSVVRLAALDKQEDFKDATDDINREIQENKCGQND
jgi:glycerol-3-phosphate O-acyltransferase/dihydroxyacetone phosphate acyltransferase